MSKEEMATDMEMEKEKNLSLFHPRRILKVGLSIIIKLFKVTPFLIRAYLPFYCAERTNALIMQKIFVLVSIRLGQFPLDIILPSWIYFSTTSLLKFSLSRMLRFHAPVFLAAVIINSFVSVMEAEEKSRIVKLKELSQGLFAISKWKGPLFRFSYLMVLSFTSYIVLMNWLASGLIIASSFKIYKVVMYVLGFIAALVKWMEFDAIWNLGAAITNEKNGLGTWKISTYFAEGGKWFALLIAGLQFEWYLRTSISRLSVEGEFIEMVYSGIISAVLYVGLLLAKVI